MLDKVLSNDSFKDVLTESVKSEIESVFNEAVEIKAVEIANEQIELEKIKLVEEFKEAKKELESKITKNIDSFINEELSKFKDEVLEKLDAVVESEKAATLVSIFDNLVDVAGSNILENYTNKDSELRDQFDKLVVENRELKAELEILQESKKIDELAANLNLVESEKFKKLASLVERGEGFESKLEALFEACKKANEDDSDADSDSKDSDDSDSDSKDSKDIKESSKNKAGAGINWANY
ncbi:Possible prohead core scaffold protein [Campylobacter phage CP220]|uniref:Possible prohead core scaffold protein n=1 Tax=Campylobacter phage CP220 TaxID=2994044 RepID=D5GV42_9CAUD|nr:Possible prohead core scaffold protein [Campylobacter phage CP220]CBJ93859.1 Possible prohead core scaffold protein [Campylobacter phage CP220]